MSASNAGNVTGPVTTPVAKASSVADPGPVKVGSVLLRGVSVLLDTDVGQAFIADCCRHTEGLVSDSEVKDKWALSDEAWSGLAANMPLLGAVRAERKRRVFNGAAAREAAQFQFAKVPNVLGGILTDEQILPRHRVEAANSAHPQHNTCTLLYCPRVQAHSVHQHKLTHSITRVASRCDIEVHSRT